MSQGTDRVMDSETKSPNTRKSQSETGYFRIIEAVGSHGPYQTYIIIIACFICFQNGLMSLGMPYYFAVAPYTNCPPPYEGITKCTAHACSLPPEQRSQFEQPEISQLKTLGNQFGDYHCDKQDQVEAVKGLYFLGGLLGMIAISPLADNVGRRPTLLLCLGAAVLGHIVLQMASSLGMAGVALFLLGSSLQSGYNMAICVLSEVLENDQRQTKITLMNALFCLAGIFVVVVFYILKAWRVCFLLFAMIPLALCLVVSFVLIKETPQFMIKKHTVQEIRTSLAWIAKINKRTTEFEQDQWVSEDNLTELKRQYELELTRAGKVAFTYWDLFKYPSLRKTTIFLGLQFGAIGILYYAPVMLIDQFGFDFYLNGLVVNSAELVTYFISYFAVTRIRRKQFNVVGSAVTMAIFFVLVFLHTKEVCTQDCWNAANIIELILIFVMRFFVSFIGQLLFVYIAELYPMQVVAIGLGFVCVVATVPTMFLPELIDLLDRTDFSVMWVFLMFSVVYLIASLFLPETRGQKPLDKILQIEGKESDVQESDPKQIELVQEQG